MPAKREKHCVYCRRPESEVGHLSARGNCLECGARAVVENAMQLHAKSGPRYEHFLKRRAALSAQALRQHSEAVAG